MKQFPKPPNIFWNILVLFLILLLNLPFLDADPDRTISIHTRGTWTDEGLYTSQIRNQINHGKFDLKENSTFVRGPIQNIIQYPVFLIFGISLEVNRLITLILTLFSLALFSFYKQYRTFGLLASLILLSQYHLFHFSHYGMAEMICINFIAIAAFFVLRAEENGKIKFLFIASACLFLCYGTKIQYLYVAGIIPLAAFLKFLINSLHHNKTDKNSLKIFLITSGFALAFFALYFFAWYLPNMKFYNYIMGSEVSERYPAFEKLIHASRFNYRNFLWVTGLKIYWILLIVSCIILTLLLSRYKHIRTSLSLLFVISWIILEIHKLPMVYFPTRYFLSLIYAAGFFVAFIFSMMYHHYKIWGAYLVLSISLLVVLNNTFINYDIYKTRTYDLKKLNNYLGQFTFDDRPVIGPWAPSCCWQNNARTFPVWNNYFNDIDPVKTNNPRIIISEHDEEESDRTYRSQGIDLSGISDSIREFDVWRYQLKIYWISENH